MGTAKELPCRCLMGRPQEGEWAHGNSPQLRRPNGGSPGQAGTKPHPARSQASQATGELKPFHWLHAAQTLFSSFGDSLTLSAASLCATEGWRAIVAAVHASGRWVLSCYSGLLYLSVQATSVFPSATSHEELA
eukprot:scaffold569_cov408-Prasinococcus_capsulatus_cf.AAC.18